MSGIEVRDASGSCVQLVEVDGIRVCNFDRTPEEEGEIIQNLKTFTCRDDDVFIIAPVKSGTYWVWEISSTLMKSDAVTISESKSKVGDWKNWFIVKQNEDFEEIYKREMADSLLRFQYSVS